MKYLMRYADGIEQEISACSVYGAMCEADRLAELRCRAERLKSYAFKVLNPEGGTVYEYCYRLKTSKNG